jgi:hypothetical protein
VVVKEEEQEGKEQRKDGVDYINLSIINIMSSIAGEFENTSWKDLPESEEDGYDKKKELLKKQLDYYNKYSDQIRDHHVDFLIKDGYIHLPEYGTHIEKNDKKGIEYALGVLDTLHNNKIYHGDIFSTPNINDKEKEVTINYGNILVKDGTYKLIDFGPTKEDESRKDPKLLEDEKTLLERYRKQQSNMAFTEQMNMELLRRRKQEERKKRRPLTPLSPNKSPKRKEGDSPNNSLKIPPKMKRMGSLRIGKLFGGRKRRRRTKKKRKRKRKSTKKKRKRKRKSTKKKRRKRR